MFRTQQIEWINNCDDSSKKATVVYRCSRVKNWLRENKSGLQTCHHLTASLKILAIFLNEQKEMDLMWLTTFVYLWNNSRFLTNVKVASMSWMWVFTSGIIPKCLSTVQTCLHTILGGISIWLTWSPTTVWS